MQVKRTFQGVYRYRRLRRQPEEERFVLRLFVAGATPASQRAIENVRALCSEHLGGRYELEVVDIYQQPESVQGVQIVAVPTLVRMMPGPLRRFIGDMSKTEQMLLGLGVVEGAARRSRELRRKSTVNSRQVQFDVGAGPRARPGK